MSEDHAELRSRLFGYVTAGAEEDDLPSFAAALDEYVAAVPHAPAAPTDAERMAAAAGILRRTADLVDREDLPQTAEDPGLRPDGFTELAAGLGPTDAERAMLRYALELVDDRIASEGDEFTDADRAAVESLKRFAGEAPVCQCGPAPHREEDGTYSHWAGCPVADAEQRAAERS